MKKTILITSILLALLLVLVGTYDQTPAYAKVSDSLAEKAAVDPDATMDVLIATTSQDYEAVTAKISELGGAVNIAFSYAQGLAANVPVSALPILSELPDVEEIALDVLRTPPGIAGESGDMDDSLRAGEVFTLDGNYETLTLSASEIEASPTTYFNMTSMNAGPVWGSGNFGQDSLVVVIDTGVYADHFMLSGSVVGGVDMSSDVGTPYEGFDLATNHWHGTHVAGIVAGHGAIVVPNDFLLVRSFEYYAGQTLPPFDADHKIVPLLGMAPAADIYGIKVFPHTGAGVPTSVIIAGIEHAIDLQVNGVYDVDVINMSLGGANTFDGRDLEDQVVDYATSVGIAVVDSAGNDGPVSITVGSPGTANTSITTGAVAHPVNTRVFWDITYGIFGIGDYLFVDDNPQMIYFSSRGPTSDGRDKPTASAVGVFVLSAFTGNPGALGFASGTSMSSPAMAGTVALLNSWGEAYGASPYDYKEAVIAGSTPLPGYDAFDQGAGFVDAADAMAALQSDGELGSPHPDLKNGYSARSAKPKGMKIQDVNEDGGYTFDIQDLAPGKAEHFYFDLHPNAERITIEFSNVDLGDDPLVFNSFEVYLSSAARTGLFNYIDTTNVYGDATFVVESMNTTVSGDVFGVNTANYPLMPGYIRFVVENDWTSFDSLSGTVTVNVENSRNAGAPDEAYGGKLMTGESYGYFPVGFGPKGVDLELSWLHDWEFYPANDMDMVVAWFDTDGVLHWEFGGATLNAPELVQIDSTDVDSVFVLVSGYETNGIDEPWKLSVNYR